MIGNSIDRGMLGGSRGPQIGDLSVQTSTYGSPLPKIYGCMRVAGTVIWSTDLRPTTTEAGTTYSVSFAVAVSSRPITGIGRIWADGTLLRGAAGDLKVPCGFRFHLGDEDQAADPLIASAEGLNLSTAYRGISYAVFEDLQLASFGNRIPSLTFEVEADSTGSVVRRLLEESSAGRILMPEEDDHRVTGYAVHGDRMLDAIEPIIDALHLRFRELDKHHQVISDGQELEPDKIELGAQQEPGGSPQHWRYAPADEIPTRASLTYYDPDRDYLLGQKQASAGASGGRTARVDLPAVLTSSLAKELAESWLANAWLERQSCRLQLPLDYIGVQPGDRVSLGDGQLKLIVRQATLEDYAISLELRAERTSAELGLGGEPGRAVAAADEPVASFRAILVDAPLPIAPTTNELCLFMAASGGSRPWIKKQVEVTGAKPIVVTTAPAEACTGVTVSRLGPGNSVLIDRANNVEVQLDDFSAWLEARSDEDLANGDNLAVIGREIVQFGQVEALGSGRFRLSRLLRGRRGTEWASHVHQPGEAFLLVQPRSLASLDLPIGLLGAELCIDPDAGPGCRLKVTGEALRPPSPVHLVAKPFDGGLRLSWVRRSALNWDWVDEIGAADRMQQRRYRAALIGSSGRLDLECAVESCDFASADIENLGQLIRAEVITLGDLLPSRPSTFNLSNTRRLS